MDFLILLILSGIALVIYYSIKANSDNVVASPARRSGNRSISFIGKTYPSLKQISKITVLDFETTGLEKDARAVEVSLIHLINGEISAILSEIVNPEQSISRRVSSIHGITNFKIQGARKFREIWTDLFPFFNNAIVVAHNASFDARILRNEINRNCLNVPKTEWWCTRKLSSYCWPRRYKSYSLQHLANVLRLESKPTHGAEDDAMTALELLNKCFETLQKRKKYELKNIRQKAMKNMPKSWPWNHK